MANDENKFLPIFQIQDIKNVSFLLKLEMALATTIRMKFEPVCLYKKVMIMTNTQARKFVFPGILYSVSILNLTMNFEHMHCRLQKNVLMKQIEAKLSQEMPRKTCFNPEQDHVFRAMQFAVVSTKIYFDKRCFCLFKGCLH